MLIVDVEKPDVCVYMHHACMFKLRDIFFKKKMFENKRICNEGKLCRTLENNCIFGDLSL